MMMKILIKITIKQYKYKITNFMYLLLYKQVRIKIVWKIRYNNKLEYLRHKKGNYKNK